MNTLSAPVSGSPIQEPAPASVDRQERESEDEKRDKLRRFTAGLQGKKPVAPQPAAAAACPTDKAKKAMMERPPEALEVPTKPHDAADGARGSEHPEPAEATGEPPQPHETLFDSLSRRIAVTAARKALHQRVMNPVRVPTQEAVDVPKPAPRAVREEKQQKKAILEDARPDPQGGPVGAVLMGAQASRPAPAQLDALPKGHPVDPATFRQMVEFAGVHRDRSGIIEFQLGLRRDVLGGAQIVMRALGDRKIGLRIKNGAGAELSEADVESLVRALRGRRLDVVEVEIV